MTAVYNEIDPFAADWLEALIREGHVAQGTVDRRSIRDLRPEDVAGATQFHAFAGIAGWSLALRLADWPDGAPVWTGSCPCQPFSSAGRRRGTADERHLWPEWFALIRECRPPVIFGEQVSSTHVLGSAGARPRVSDGVPTAPSGAGSNPPRERAGEQEGDRVRSGQPHSRNSIANRRRSVRGDGPPVFAGRGEDVGQPIAGPDRSLRGLPLFECSRGLPRAEQCNGGLGGEQADRDGARDPFSATRRIEQLIQAHWGAAERDARLAWFDLVSDDLERAGYSVGACVLPACGVGAPHIRQRLYFVAVAEGARLPRREPGASDPDAPGPGAERRGDAGALADSRGHECRPRRDCGADGDRAQQLAGRRNAGALALSSGGGFVEGLTDRRWSGSGDPAPLDRRRPADDCDAGLLGNVCGPGLAGRPGERSDDGAERPAAERAGGATSGPWSDAVWLPCRDGRARPAQPGAQPLAHGVPGRVGRLRGYGNAIVPEVAATFIRAVMTIGDVEPATAGGGER